MVNMGPQFVAAILLVALVGGSQADEVPEDLSFIYSIIEPYLSNCTFGTVSCSSDCANVQICLGGEEPEIVEVCSSGSMCDASTLTCNPNLAKCNVIDTTKMTCHGTVGGRFPNPYDCHSYFECEEPIPIPPVVVDQIKCRNSNSAFDSESGTCRLSSSHRVCTEGPVPKCQALMQHGALIENPNIFYICVNIEGVLQPILARCPEETDVFEGGKCIDIDHTSTSTPNPPTTPTTSETEDTSEAE